MANCRLCGKKLSFMEGEPFLVGERIQGVPAGDSYTLCSTCFDKVNAAKRKDVTAQEEVRILLNCAIKDTRKRKEFANFLNIPQTQDEIDMLKSQAKDAKEKRQFQENYQKDEISRVMDAINTYQERHPAVFELEGCRGRSMKVYDDRVVISTDLPIGSVLTSNATDGEKTVFYHDVVGIQYKEPGLTIGYLQLETASLQMNNQASNQFSENTFTFEKGTQQVEIAKKYIIWQISQFKH